MSMRKLIALTALALATPVAAQFSDSFNFLKAVRDKDGAKAKALIDAPGATTIDTRDRDTGEAALHIVAKRRDTQWLGFLLGNGANPNVRDASGDTPLLIASGIGLTDGVELLLRVRAQVDLANNRGETPLIRAVQVRDAAVARVLLEAGADPDKTDNTAGLSARDYAGQTRGPVARLLAEAPRRGTKAQVAGPRL